jgi:hypothetical protein
MVYTEPNFLEADNPCSITAVLVAVPFVGGDSKVNFRKLCAVIPKPRAVPEGRGISRVPSPQYDPREILRSA